MRKIISGRRPDQRAFKFTINTGSHSGTSPAGTMILPIPSGSASGGGLISMSIDWGDGNTSELNSVNHGTARQHTYTTGGTYQISITGAIRGWEFGGMSSGANQDDAKKMSSIDQWGDFKFTERRAFTGCSNMTAIQCTDLPTFERSTVGFNMFSGCTKLQRINRWNDWNVSNLTTGYAMFSGCNALRFCDLGTGIPNFTTWDVSSMQSMYFMFNNCGLFNGKMFTVTSTTTNMGSMFSGCGNFNNAGTTSIENWDTSQVADMRMMFFQCITFNRDISGWDTSSATTMQDMFNGSNNAMVFNQPIGAWDTSSVTNMTSILRNCSSFDQDLSNWDLTAVTNAGSGTNLVICSSVSNSFSFPIVLSQANYDALLIALDASTYPSWPGGTLAFGLSQYSAAPSAAATARASLVTKFGAVQDGGPI